MRSEREWQVTLVRRGRAASLGGVAVLAVLAAVLVVRPGRGQDVLPQRAGGPGTGRPRPSGGAMEPLPGRRTEKPLSGPLPRRGTEGRPPERVWTPVREAVSPADEPDTGADEEGMRSLSGWARVTSPLPVGTLLIEGCGDKTWAGPDGSRELWGSGGPCRIRVVRFNGEASAVGPWRNVAAGGDRTDLELIVPPAPDFQPLMSLDDEEYREMVDRIAVGEAMLRDATDEEYRAEIQKMLDFMYKAAGIQDRIPPATDAEIEAWRRRYEAAHPPE